MTQIKNGVYKAVFTVSVPVLLGALVMMARGELETLRSRFEDHQDLEGHPVGMAKMKMLKETLERSLDEIQADIKEIKRSLEKR